MPHHKPVSGDLAVKILCNRFGFKLSGRAGSHVRLSKNTLEGKVGTVVPIHDELKPGTLKSILKLARVDPGEFYRFV